MISLSRHKFFMEQKIVLSKKVLLDMNALFNISIFLYIIAPVFAHNSLIVRDNDILRAKYQK